MADNETASPNWPDLTIAFTALTCLVFLCSLFFIFGLSSGLHHDIAGLCDLTDYLRVAPSWMLPTLGWFVYGTLWKWGSQQVNKVEQNEKLAPAIRLARWWDKSDSTRWIVTSALGIITGTIHAFHKNSVWAFLTAIFYSSAANDAAHVFLPGWRQVFHLPDRFWFFIPRTVLVITFSYWLGVYWLTLYGGTLSSRTVTMKDRSQYSGRVILELNRYLVLQKADKELLAIQSSEIQAMVLVDKFRHTAKTQRSPAISPSNSPSPVSSATPVIPQIPKSNS